jgi:hypothetical protein
MSTVTLYRASGLALLLGAALFIIGLALAFVFKTDTPLGLAMAGVWTSGLVLLLSTSPAMNLVGTFLTWGGLLLLGSATMRARVFSPWAALFLILAVVADFFTTLGGLVMSIAQPLSNVVLVLGLGWMGYALLTAKGEAEAVPQPVPAS